MSTSSALRTFEDLATPRAHAWRPGPEGSEPSVLCIDEGSATLPPRINARFTLVILRSPAIVRVESSRSVFAGHGAVLLVPPWRLHAVRAPNARAPVAVTLLMGAPGTNGLAVADCPMLVTEAELVAEVAALVAQWRGAVRQAYAASSIHSLLMVLAARAVPIPSARVGRATPLAPIRDRLRAALDEPVPTAELARMSGLTEWHLIRAFHREFGLPPHAYHLRLRLAAACELLSTGVGVSSVAYECGFADQSHLSRKFREVYGVTPASWGRAGSVMIPREMQSVHHRAARRQQDTLLRR